MKVALNDKNVKEVDSQLGCKNCILYSYTFCPCHFNRSTIMIKDSSLSEIFYYESKL